MKVFLIFIVSLVLSAAVVADEDNVKKYRNFTPMQVKALSKKVISSEMPMMYTFAARRGLAPDADLLFAMQLNMLMYPGIGNYESAVRSFQKDIGDTATGNLTVHQIHQLEYRAEMQKLSKVIFPDSFQSWKTGDSAGIKGTVTILDEKIAWPINYHTVKCIKAGGVCEVTQVVLNLPNEKSWTQLYNLMLDETEYYDITRWTDDIIDANYPAKKNDCRHTSLNLNFKTKEFYFVTKNAREKCEVLGTPLEKLTKPRISQIIKGEKIINDEFAKIRKKAFELLASDFRKKAEKFTDKDIKQ